MRKLFVALSLGTLFIGCATTNSIQATCPSTITQLPGNNCQPQSIASNNYNNADPTSLVNTSNDICYISNPVSLSQCTCNNCILRIEVKGMGTTPINAVSTAQAKLMARRAAILNGYKALVEKLYGIRVSSRETMRNMILQNSNLRAYVDGLIRGANIEDEGFKDGIYTVVMSVKLDLMEWNNYIKNRSSNVIYDF